MYVKVNVGYGRSTLYPVSASLRVGRFWSAVPPDERNYNTELETDIHTLHVNGINDESNSEADSKPLWEYKYAVWMDAADGITAAVTSRRMFILSDKGDTIDSP